VGRAFLRTCNAGKNIDQRSGEHLDDVDNVLRTRDSLSVPAFALLRAMDHNRSRVAAEHGVSVSELRALSWIAEAGSITPKLLAESLGMTTGAVTAISNHLVELNMLTRLPHPHDRRSLLLVLTPAAQEAAEKLQAEFQTLFTHAARDVTPDVQARLGSLLTSMAVAISSDTHVSAAGPTASVFSRDRPRGGGFPDRREELGNPLDTSDR